MQAINTGRREYRMRGWRKIFLVLLGLVFCGMGINFAEKFLQLPKAGAAATIATIGPAVISALWVCVGIFSLAMALRPRLVIDGTRIAVRLVFRERSADFSEVAGFRTVTTGNGSIWQLELKQGLGSITIPRWFDCDELRAWFGQLTDLDKQGR